MTTLDTGSVELDAYFFGLAARANAVDIEVPPLDLTGDTAAVVPLARRHQSRRRSRQVLAAAATVLAVAAGTLAITATRDTAEPVVASDPTQRVADDIEPLFFAGSQHSAPYGWTGGFDGAKDAHITTWVGGEVGGAPIAISIIEATTLESLAAFEIHFEGIRLHDFLFGTGEGAPVHDGVSAMGSGDEPALGAPEGVMVRMLDTELNLDGAEVMPGKADVARSMLLYSLGDRYALVVATGGGDNATDGPDTWAVRLRERIEVIETDGIRSVDFSTDNFGLFTVAELETVNAVEGTVVGESDAPGEPQRSVLTTVAGWGTFALHDWNQQRLTLVRTDVNWVVTDDAGDNDDGDHNAQWPLVRGFSHGQYATAYLSPGDDLVAWFDRIEPLAEG